ncbi:MAG: PEGA domain-containing protein [Butyrivibrio sp.]|nr:PEGA domain-containing protein [Butyrivibrio sp.]
MEKKKKISIVLLSAMVVMVYMLGTGGMVSALAQESSDKVNISLIGKYDSADTAAIRSIDTDNRQIKFRNHTTGKTYTLSYDNTSMMYDIYGDPMSVRLLEQGQIVDVTFLKSTRNITTLNVSKDAWVIENTRDHNLVKSDGTATIKGQTYKIDARTMVIADDKLALAEDVLSTDSIYASGIGKEIYSIVVTSGHGYVSLSSDVVEDQSLVGAWIELDNEVIYKISPNMMLSAPEGDYTLQILGNGANYQSEVNVARNQETVVDTSDITITRPKDGLVTFEITPSYADVYVDGQKMLTGIPQTIQYGYHNLKIMADGYETQTKYLKVGTPKSVITLELEKKESATDSTSTSSTASSTVVSKAASTQDSIRRDNTVSAASVATSKKKETVSENSSKEKPQNTVITGYRIYFDEPYEAEIYFDGSYVGIVPTNMTKISGNHEVIIKKDGYETKSYRIYIDSAESDLSYKFPALVKINKDESSSSSTASTAASGSSASSSASSASSDASSSASSASTVESTESSTNTSGGSSEDITNNSGNSAESSMNISEESDETSASSNGNTTKATDFQGNSSTGSSGGSENTNKGDAGTSDAASTASASTGD